MKPMINVTYNRTAIRVYRNHKLIFIKRFKETAQLFKALDQIRSMNMAGVFNE